MNVLTPADPTLPVHTVGRSGPGQWPDTTIRVSPGGGELVIRTIERVGMRMNENGNVEGVMSDMGSMAALAVGEYLLGRIDQGLAREDNRAAVERIDSESESVDWALWQSHRMLVDGIAFALRVRQMDGGFAAIADLGPVTITMRGTRLPDDLRFTLHRPV